MDDEFHHALGVLQDEKTGGLRLVASVWAGELGRCPVWIAFGMFGIYFSFCFEMVCSLGFRFYVNNTYLEDLCCFGWWIEHGWYNHAVVNLCGVLVSGMSRMIEADINVW